VEERGRGSRTSGMALSIPRFSGAPRDLVRCWASGDLDCGFLLGERCGVIAGAASPHMQGPRYVDAMGARQPAGRRCSAAGLCAVSSVDMASIEQSRPGPAPPRRTPTQPLEPIRQDGSERFRAGRWSGRVDWAFPIVIRRGAEEGARATCGRRWTPWGGGRWRPRHPGRGGGRRGQERTHRWRRRARVRGIPAT